MKVDVILGLQWGDEGKGKIVDVFSPHYDIIARFQGGPNAGHTIEFDGKKFILHTIPSGIFHPDKINVIGNGVIIDPFIFFREIGKLRDAGLKPEDNLYLSRRAHLIIPTHRLLDAALEAAKGASKIGSTLKGIGPAYTDKYGRNGIRIGSVTEPDFRKQYETLKEFHLSIVRHYGFDYSGYLIDGLSFDDYERGWFDAASRLIEFRHIDSEYFLNEALDKGKTILAEGAQGSLLDVDFGSYPYVTSSNTISAGVCSGLGIAPHRIGKIYGVFKAYCTRVGSGPFPTELHDGTGEFIRKAGHEFGSTTGRPRRCGWLDLPALRYSIMLNGVNSLIMMKADVMTGLDPIYICENYKIEDEISSKLPYNLDRSDVQPVLRPIEGWKTDIRNSVSKDDLPVELRNYIRLIEEKVGLPVKMVSTGPDRTQTVMTGVL